MMQNTLLQDQPQIETLTKKEKFNQNPLLKEGFFYSLHGIEIGVLSSGISSLLTIVFQGNKLLITSN